MTSYSCKQRDDSSRLNNQAIMHFNRSRRVSLRAIYEPIFMFFVYSVSFGILKISLILLLLCRFFAYSKDLKRVSKYSNHRNIEIISLSWSTMQVDLRCKRIFVLARCQEEENCNFSQLMHITSDH